MTVAATLNKTSFALGELVVISGSVRDSQGRPIADVSVSIQVDEPRGSTVHVASLLSNATGQFRDQFSVAGNSQLGEYTAFINANKPGFNCAASPCVQAKYTVIPEFPEISIGMIVSGLLLFSLFLLRRRRQPNVLPVDLGVR